MTGKKLFMISKVAEYWSLWLAEIYITIVSRTHLIVQSKDEKELNHTKNSCSVDIKGKTATLLSLITLFSYYTVNLLVIHMFLLPLVSWGKAPDQTDFYSTVFDGQKVVPADYYDQDL